MGIRLCFATAREGHMVHVLSYVHVDSSAPTPALLFTVSTISELMYFNLICDANQNLITLCRQ